MRVYSYSVRDAVNGNKLVGGTVHANDMESAAKIAVRRCGLAIRQTENDYYVTNDFLRDGRKVYVSIGVHPEYFIGYDLIPVSYN